MIPIHHIFTLYVQSTLPIMLGTFYVFVNVPKNSVMGKMLKFLSKIQKKNLVKFEISSTK